VRRHLHRHAFGQPRPASQYWNLWWLSLVIPHDCIEILPFTILYTNILSKWTIFMLFVNVGIYIYIYCYIPIKPSVVAKLNGLVNQLQNSGGRLLSTWKFHLVPFGRFLIVWIWNMCMFHNVSQTCANDSSLSFRLPCWLLIHFDGGYSVVFDQRSGFGHCPDG